MQSFGGVVCELYLERCTFQTIAKPERYKISAVYFSYLSQMTRDQSINRGEVTLETSAKRKNMDWVSNQRQNRSSSPSVDSKLSGYAQCEYFVIEAAKSSTHDDRGAKHDDDYAKLIRHLQDTLCCMKLKAGITSVLKPDQSWVVRRCGPWGRRRADLGGTCQKPTA